MFIRLETTSGVPLSRQIADQIRGLCASGKFSPGERLPSVRVLARDLAVNQNTILHVYERLSMEGLLEMRHGDGTYVARRPSAAQIKKQWEALEAEAEGLARRAATLGMGIKDLRGILERAFHRLQREKVS